MAMRNSSGETGSMRTPFTSGPSSRRLHVCARAVATAARSAGKATLGAGSLVVLARARSREDGVGLRGAAPGQHVVEDRADLVHVLGGEVPLLRLLQSILEVRLRLP